MWQVTTVLLLCGAKFMLQEHIILSPALPYALENTSLELTCIAPINTIYTQWGTLGRPDIFAHLYVSKEEACITDGFLNDTRYFETECNMNGYFKIRIKKVNGSNHGQKWYCSDILIQSNVAKISVQVSTKYVTYKNIYGDVLNVLETMKTTLTCETSEGRPAANITWIQISKEGIEIDMTNDVIYNVSDREILLFENGLTKVQSSIDIVPNRQDNNTRIVCKASNRKHAEVKKEVTLLVKYPPDKPLLYVNDRIVNGSIRIINGKNMSVICKSDSYPFPKYMWNSTCSSRNSENNYLNSSNIVRNCTLQCSAINYMTLTNKKSKVGNSRATLKIHVLSPASKPVLSMVKGNHTLTETLFAVRNEIVTLSCRSDGDPVPTYQWNGQNPGAKLHIESVQTSTNETCIASNEMRDTLGEERNRSVSTMVSIIVSYPPERPYFVCSGHTKSEETGEKKTRVTIQEYNVFTVSCKANGFPPPSCTWNVQGDKESSNLTFLNTTKDAIGKYTCNAQNVVQRSFPPYKRKYITSKELEIDVLYQSRVVIFNIVGLEQKLSIFEVNEDETIIFYCGVDSNPASSIALSYREVELAHAFSATTLTYAHQVTFCNGDEGGVYKCAAQNDYSSRPSFKEIKLMVRCKPRVSPGFTVKSTVSTARNRNVTFEFKTIAKPAPAFFWFKLNGSSWNSITTSYKYSIYTSELYSNITVRNVTEDDYGHYMLKIQNEIGSLEKLFFLNAKVSLSKQLHFMIAEKGLEGNMYKVDINENIYIMCLSDSDLPSDIVISKQDGERISMTKNTTFVRHTIYKVSCDDAGEYRCAARNILTLQQETVSKLELIVKCPPIPSVKTNMESPIVSVLHSDVTLQLEVYGYFDDPSNTVFLWYKHNFTLPNDGRKYIVQSRGFQSNLVIRNIVITDFGQYTVLVRNSYGQYIHKFELIQKEQTILESTTARILLALGGTLMMFVIVAVVVTLIRFKHTRREQSDRHDTGQIADVDVNRIPSIEDDNEDDAHYQEINVYEYLDQQLTERADYIEMQSIESDDSNKYYITPIHH